MPRKPKSRQVRPPKRDRSKASSSSCSSAGDEDVAFTSDCSTGFETADDVFNEVEISSDCIISRDLSACYDGDDDESVDGEVHSIQSQSAPSTSTDCFPESVVREVVSPDHSYFSLNPIVVGPYLKSKPSGRSSVSPIPLPPEFSEPSVTQDMSLILQDASSKISMFLYQSWMCHVSDGGIHVMLLSKKFEKAVQRRLFFSPDGNVQLSVHCQPVPVTDYIKNATPAVSLDRETIGYFVDRCVEVINNARKEEICSGLSDEEYKDVWHCISDTVIDKNPYQENRYSETLRSSKCSRLISIRKWRCGECEKMRRNVQRRAAAFRKEEVSKFTPNAALSDSQKSAKLEIKQKTIRAQSRRLVRLEKKIQLMLQVEGVHVDKEMSNELTELCKSADLSEVQSLFLQQQLEASKAKSPSAVRWHPTMIRFALAIYLDALGVYEKMRDSGVLALPSSRLLWDYTHVNPAEEGVYDYALEDINKKTSRYGRLSEISRSPL
ncbi:[Pyruvate dehydrogenase [acetyl-transferring]]-phosphatase 2, mitochondrial [Frankliniella fusca]|uniref:[Pyruvate dehydrogenase [acetyl-transferring]]-phosphatase 2, mitochondrial n=1 Tax=Frankliniella fusca TaxID=407009 RepID=A0AAE1I4D4_9NEOP|nr:[Pyruvate dehydrogenase [acetyl-transferring]]-phosphatase 2, mitochondrial [Frankliniella fusca]